MLVLVKKEDWGEPPYWTDIPCTYEAFRELVEGDWSSAPTRVKGVCVVYDEKAYGKRNYNMATWDMDRHNPQNVYIAGTAVFAGYAEGAFVEMTRLQKKEVFEKYFDLYQKFNSSDLKRRPYRMEEGLPPEAYADKIAYDCEQLRKNIAGLEDVEALKKFVMESGLSEEEIEEYDQTARESFFVISMLSDEIPCSAVMAGETLQEKLLEKAQLVIRLCEADADRIALYHAEYTRKELKWRRRVIRRVMQDLPGEKQNLVWMSLNRADRRGV